MPLIVVPRPTDSQRPPVGWNIVFWITNHTDRELLPSLIYAELCALKYTMLPCYSTGFSSQVLSFPGDAPPLNATMTALHNTLDRSNINFFANIYVIEFGKVFIEITEGEG